MLKVGQGEAWVVEAGGGQLRDAVTLTAAVAPLIRQSEPDQPHAKSAGQLTRALMVQNLNAFEAPSAVGDFQVFGPETGATIGRRPCRV